MKKSSLGLFVAFIAFSCGVFVVGIFHFKQKPVTAPLFDNNIVNAPLPETAPIDETEESETVEYFNPTIIHAWYYSRDSYKGMPEVVMIYFYGTDYDDDGVNLKKMVYQSGIYTNLYEDDVYEGFVEGIQTTVKGNKLEFKTKKIKGIEYSFQGKFFKNKMIGKQDEKVLRGTLQKFVKGKKVAEVTGDFAYSEPHCLY